MQNVPQNLHRIQGVNHLNKVLDYASLVEDEGRATVHLTPEDWHVVMDTLFHMKTPKEELPDAISNTLELAERCNLDLETETFHMPNFPLPENESTPESYLEHLVWTGVEERYETVDETIKKRVRHELDTINKMGFPGYFLIVKDFINFAKENGIPVAHPGHVDLRNAAV